MIQQVDSPKITEEGCEPHWGQWHGQRHYSLEVVQHPLRARMCGFGDKDRRPLAPAAVAKMVVRLRDDTVVDVDDVECSFFLVTVDLWSADGKQDMNLVLHPSSADRSSLPPVKPKRTGASNPTPYSRSSGRQTPSSQAASTPTHLSHYSPRLAETVPHCPPSSSQFGQGPPRNSSFPPHSHPPTQSISRAHSNGTDCSYSEAEQEVSPYRAWAPDAAYHQSIDPVPNLYIDPALRGPSTEAFAPSHQSPRPPPYYSMNYPPTVQVASQPATAGAHRHTYTRTLIGPLSANACRLSDEHRKPGIFFLFQDLSVRTEGTFRLRLRLMNIGALPAPEAGATRVHNDVSPVLAQAFTEPFVVHSAKRFPGVPDTTALSIALGNQGQKLPLRNRHGSSKRRRHDGSGSDDSDEA